MSRRLKLLAAVVLVPSGCGVPLPPRETSPAEDGPWVAPGRQSPAKLKEYLDVPDNTGYSYWVGGDGGRVKIGDRIGALSDYLDATGHLRKWPGPKRFLGRDWWTAPFDFTLVSLTPGVVLMTPAAHDPDNDEAFGRLVSTTDEDRGRRFHGGGKLANGYRVGPQARYAPGMKWFSDDLNRPPAALAFGPNGAAEIALPDGRLVIARDGETLAATRE